MISCQSENKHTMFKKHFARESGLDFNNKLKLDGELIVLDFEYMFNGAGVAIADFDNDGLEDIYFTANMVSNKLYKNLGDWKFKDITNSSKTGTTQWSNGVAIVDINQDGLKDIYVCKGGPRGSSAQDRANLLFVNKGIVNGELKFEEEAKLWGLNDSSYSVQATFFDYDADGDLDMYLLCNALVDFNRNTSRPKDRNGKAPSKDKLFRNNGPSETTGQITYTDVSSEAGILTEGFGLGVEVCDINLDGWFDIYVSNDFLTDDILYVNQKDGTFKNSTSDYIKHLTFNGMGSDIADINNDGLMDIVVLDMLPPDNKRWKLTMMGNNYDEHENGLSYGYQPQYIRNTLQINNGNGSFSELGQLAGISATEWSWGPLIADFDNDGKSDLFITNGYRQDITNLDFMMYSNQVLTMGTVEANKKARLNELNKYPGIKVHNYLYKNKGDLNFDDISIEAGFDEATYSNGVAYADLDNDGDLDIVFNNIDDDAGLYENTTKLNDDNNYLRINLIGDNLNKEAIGSTVKLYFGNQSLTQFNTAIRGYLSSVEQTLHFGMGTTKKVDSIYVIWPNGKHSIIKDISTNQELTIQYNESTIDHSTTIENKNQLFVKEQFRGVNFKHKEDYFVDYKIQTLLPHMHSKNGPGISVADLNGDGLEDFYVGGASGQKGSLFFQQEDQSFTALEFGDIDQEVMGSLFFDADNDGDQDLYVVGGGAAFENNQLYKDFLYENDGLGHFSKTNALSDHYISGSVVAAADYDKDGDLDLFVGGRVKPGEYPLAAQSLLLKNSSTSAGISFEKDTQENNQVFSFLGMVTAALWTDFNNDSWHDLIVVGEFMEIRFFENDHGKLYEVTNNSGLENTHGWWNSITGGDFDNDGDIDYVLGNLGLNSRYKASAKEPLSIVSKDFDANGQIDPIMCQYIDGVNQITHSRKDLVAQISSMRGRFRNYSDYANATFKESFNKKELEGAYIVKSETFASSYLENIGNGKFKLSALPRFAQVAPIFGMLTNDFNNDGNLDVLAVGNFYNGEVFNGRYDASTGWLMLGDGHGNFENSRITESGFYVQEDAKGLANLFVDNKELIVAGINNDGLKIHSIDRRDSKIIDPSNSDISAILKYKNGNSQKREFYYGSGYLSSPSRKIVLSSDVTSVVMKNNNGNESEILQ